MYRNLVLVGMFALIGFVLACTAVQAVPVDEQAPAPTAAPAAPAPTAAPAAPAPTAAPVSAPKQPMYDSNGQMGTVGPNWIGYYTPDPTIPGYKYGYLPQGEPYHIKGKQGSEWVLIRLPAVGEFWVLRAQLPDGVDLTWVPEVR